MRLLYAKNRERVRRTASCPSSGGACTWIAQGKTEFTGTLMLAALNGAQVEQTTVLDGITAQAASAGVDAQGRIHLLVAGAPNLGDHYVSELYYLRLGSTK
jgi:hypothetical protein